MLAVEWRLLRTRGKELNCKLLQAFHVKILSISSKSCQTPSLRALGSVKWELHYCWEPRGKAGPSLCQLRAPYPECAHRTVQKQRQILGFELQKLLPCCVLWLCRFRVHLWRCLRSMRHWQVFVLGGYYWSRAQDKEEDALLFWSDSFLWHWAWSAGLALKWP